MQWRAGAEGQVRVAGLEVGVDALDVDEDGGAGGRTDPGELEVGGGEAPEAERGRRVLGERLADERRRHRWRCRGPCEEAGDQEADRGVGGELARVEQREELVLEVRRGCSRWACARPGREPGRRRAERGARRARRAVHGPPDVRRVVDGISRQAVDGGGRRGRRDAEQVAEDGERVAGGEVRHQVDRAVGGAASASASSERATSSIRSVGGAHLLGAEQRGEGLRSAAWGGPSRVVSDICSAAVGSRPAVRRSQPGGASAGSLAKRVSASTCRARRCR